MYCNVFKVIDTKL